ncbi:hypothetical protein D3C76_1210050 [compost metagenome]
MRDERVEKFGARGTRGHDTPIVADILEGTVFVLQLEVVPVFAPDKSAGVAVGQFEVMHALEDLRIGFTFLEILAPVVTGGREAGAAIVATDQFGLGFGHGPTGTDRQRRVELAVKLTEVEACGANRCRCRRHGHCQQAALERSDMH